MTWTHQVTLYNEAGDKIANIYCQLERSNRGDLLRAVGNDPEYPGGKLVARWDDRARCFVQNNFAALPVRVWERQEQKRSPGAERFERDEGHRVVVWVEVSDGPLTWDSTGPKVVVTMKGATSRVLVPMAAVGQYCEPAKYGGPTFAKLLNSGAIWPASRLPKTDKGERRVWNRGSWTERPAPEPKAKGRDD